jgi:hypothetical protein
MVPDTYCFCPGCAARVELGRIALGAAVACPICGREFVPSRGQSSSPAAQPSRLPEKAGRLHHQDQGTQEELAAPFGDQPTPGQRQQWAWESVARRPPLRLFFGGVYRFPFYMETLGQTLALVAGAIVAVAAIRLLLWCAIADREGLDRYTRVLLWNGILLSTVLSALATLPWIVAAAAYGLTVIRETSFGADRVADWPHFLALEGLGDWVYVCSGGLLATLPAVLATPLWHWLGTSRWPAVAVGLPLLYPVFLLSMLETNSPANPLSPWVWKSILVGWRAWVEFYLITFALGGAIVAVVRRLPAAGAPTTLASAAAAAAIGALLSLAWLVYCRLLGRLACFCSGNWD